jgi:hypothetical protein
LYQGIKELPASTGKYKGVKAKVTISDCEPLGYISANTSKPKRQWLFYLLSRKHQSEKSNCRINIFSERLLPWPCYILKAAIKLTSIDG